jgi:hexosaminidase
MVLGGEAAAWSEFITAENLDLKLWPRAGAVAERLWSRREQTDVAFLYERFPWLLQELGWLGVDPTAVRRRMLARAAGPVDVDALDRASDYLEPVKRYHRADSGNYTVFRPLNRLVDTLWPESLPARRLRLETAAATESVPARVDPERLRMLATSFAAIRDAALQVMPDMAGSALLSDAAEDLGALTNTARMAEEMALALSEGKPMDPQQVVAFRRAVDAYRARQGEILNQLLEPTNSLLAALERREAKNRAGEAPQR